MTLRRPLRVARIAAALGEGRFARDLRHLGVPPSTADLGRELAARDGGDGCVLVAEGQSAGRGRRGSPWVSPTGKGIWLSAIAKPAPTGATERRLLAPVCGLAVVRTLESVGVDARIKWPNDVLVGGRKIAGCLIDLGDDVDGVPYAVISIGLNVNLERADLPADASFPATSLRLATGASMAREPLVIAFLGALDQLLTALADGRWDDLTRDLLARDALAGARVTATVGPRTVEGRVVEAHPVAGLLLRHDDGTEERLPPEHTHVVRATLQGAHS